MNSRQAKKKRAVSKHREEPKSNRLLFQELEPRVLYSADGIGGADALVSENTVVELVIEQSVVTENEAAILENASETPSQPDLNVVSAKSTGELTREIVFVDTDTPQYQQLVDDLLNNADEDRQFDVFLLDDTRDGIEQISEILAGYDSLDAMHIISHGDDGTIDLGNTQLDLGSLNANAEAIGSWGGAFVETGDLLIYGCNLATTAEGESFVNTLAELTETDVAASDDLTGNLLLGGDWDLEYTTGTVETAVAVGAEVQENWNQVLVEYTVNTTAATGTGSLAEAIGFANSSVGVDNAIKFAIGTGAQTILIDPAGLPAIIGTVTIDATSQPGYAGEPLITLDGTNVVSGNGHGLEFNGNADGSEVRALSIVNFSASGIKINTGADNVTIAGNWIGTTGSSTTGDGNGDDGIDTRALNTTIGGLGSNDGNVIANNADEQINIQGSGVTGHLIQGNIIGLDPDGVTTSNSGDVGIAIISGSHNTIGGTTVAARNIISNNVEGIEINTEFNIVQGNFIGTDISGTLDRGNHADDGIDLQNSANNNLIGGDAEGAGNLIAYNALEGVHVKAGSSNDIVGNTITQNVRSGIVSTTSTTRIVGNVVYSNSTGFTLDEIRVVGSDVSLYHNMVHGSKSDGIEVVGSNAVIRNNIVTGSAGYGIRINGGSIWIESNNLITDAVTGPANLAGSANFALDGSDLNADPL
ncbi:MAG: hypothetical protein ACI915_003413, partial [Gammaproteobacteria bacterium]